MAETKDLAGLLMAIAAGDNALVRASIGAAPALATAHLARRDEFIIAHCHARVYEGATALHAAAFAYDRETAQDLVARGADIRARDRRGAEPLHAAVIGEPGTPNWNPARQRTVIEYLVDAGANPNAAALGGVTRCTEPSGTDAQPLWRPFSARAPTPARQTTTAPPPPTSHTGPRGEVVWDPRQRRPNSGSSSTS